MNAKHLAWLLPLVAIPAIAYAAAPLATPADRPDPETAATTTPEDDPLQAAEWEGRIAAGALDLFAHVRPTEDVLAPVARMGAIVTVPDDATALAFRFRSDDRVPFHFMVHGPDEEGMPTYMTDVPAGEEGCLGIPLDGVLPGEWRVMAHAPRDAIDVTFTLVTEVAADTPPIYADAFHGHEGDMAMDMREADPCATA